MNQKTDIPVAKEGEESLEEFLGQPAGKKSSKLKRWGWVIGLGLILLLMITSLIGGGSKAPQYATAEVQRGDMMVHVTATGNLEPTNEVSVGSELSGLIDEVFVDINDRVNKNDPLVQIDTEKLKDAILRSEASLEQAKASVLQAEASVELTRASQARLEEVHRLSGGKVPSQAELDSVQAESKRAIANLASARASVSAARAQLSTDHTNLDKATVRSPVDGVILSRQIEPGQTVAASFSTPTLFVIAEDLAAMKLEVKVDEADVGQVATGQPTTFTVDAYPGKTFEAVITRVNVGANSSTASSTASSASTVVSYGAVLTVNNEDLALRPGMTATASILTSREQGALLVPNAALRYTPGGLTEEAQGLFSGPKGSTRQEVGIGRGSLQQLTVLSAEGELSQLAVRVGNTDGNWTIVSGEGLREGLNVVTGELALVR